MSSLAAAIGLLVLGIGLAVIASPGVLRGILRRFLESRWLYWVSGLRVLVGGILIIAAPATRMPGFVGAFGVLLVAAGVSIPLLGEARVDRMAQWWSRQPDWTLRAWGALAAFVGGALLWTGL